MNNLTDRQNDQKRDTVVLDLTYSMSAGTNDQGVLNKNKTSVQFFIVNEDSQVDIYS